MRGVEFVPYKTAVELRDFEKLCKKHKINNDLELAHPHSGPSST